MNRYGITVATSKIVSAKVPDRPTKPIVYQNSDVSALVVWQLPPYNDNSGIIEIIFISCKNFNIKNFYFKKVMQIF